MPRFLRRERWSLKPPFQPYPYLSARAVYSLWHCLSVTVFTAASRVYPRLNRGYTAPCPIGVRTFLLRLAPRATLRSSKTPLGWGRKGPMASLLLNCFALRFCGRGRDSGPASYSSSQQKIKFPSYIFASFGTCRKRPTNPGLGGSSALTFVVLFG